MEKGGEEVLVPLKSSLKSRKGNGAALDKTNKVKKAKLRAKGAKHGKSDEKDDFSSPESPYPLNPSKAATPKNVVKARAPDGRPRFELKIEQEIPEHATCLMNCEAKEMLEHINSQMTRLSGTSPVKLPISFEPTLTYLKKNDLYSNSTDARIILNDLRKHGVPDGEICLLGNICPKSSEEAFALVPSLKTNDMCQVQLDPVLGELLKLKRLA